MAPGAPVLAERRGSTLGLTPGRAVAAMVVAALLWGATFVVARDALEALAPASLVGIRFGAAALVWALVLSGRGMAGAGSRRPGSLGAAWVGGLVSGPLMAGGYLFQAIGLTETSAGSSAFLTAAGTLFAALFAWPLLGARPGATLCVGLAVAMTGSALLGIRDGLRLGAGEAWTLMGALVYALQIVAVARWAAVADPLTLVAVQAGVTALLTLPFASRLGSAWQGLNPADGWRLAYLVLAGSLVAPLLQVLAQRVLPPGRIGLLFALEPVFALGFALGWGGERFVARWWMGAGLILAAVILVEGRAARARASSR